MIIDCKSVMIKINCTVLCLNTSSVFLKVFTNLTSRDKQEEDSSFLVSTGNSCQHLDVLYSSMFSI